MTIYVEQSFLQNFIIDYLLLKLSLKIYNYKTKKINIILAAILGSVISLIAPLIYSVYSILLKIILSILMCIIISPTFKIKQVISVFLSFLLSTFMFGGISLMAQNSISQFNNKQLNLPYFYVLVLSILAFYLIVLISKKIYKRKTATKFEYTVTLFSESASLKAQAFLDSGNLLTDNNEPVILIDSLTFLKLYPNESLSEVLLKKINNLSMKNTHILKIKNINNTYSELVVFTLPKIQIDEKKTIFNIPCAITLKKFNLQLPTSCLLNPLLF